MATYTPELLTTAATGTVDFVKDLARDIVGTMKGLYRQYPRGFVPGDPNSGAGALLRSYWDSFFGRYDDGTPLPDPPESPFDGGQCACVQYTVEFSVEIRRKGDNQLVDTRVTSLSAWGPLTGIAIEDPSPARSDSVAVVLRGSGPDCQPGYFSNTSASNELFYMTNLQVFSTVRNDGQPDNCGSLPAQFPANGLPPATNPGVYVFPSPGGGAPIPYSIDFDPTLIVPIVKVDLNGEVEVPISFDAGGINVDLPDLNIGEGDSGGVSPEALEALLDAASKIPGIQENIEDLVNGGDQTSDDLGETEGENEGYVPNIAGLVIQVTGIPLGTGRKFGKPQIFDFGRVHFKRGDFYSSEIPIATVRQWSPAPVDADGYAIYLKPGVTANVTVVRQVKENGGLN